MSIDPKTGRIFLVAAESAPASATSTPPGDHHPTYAPDSVKLRYVDPKPLAASQSVSGSR
jgi:hypothetical protein